jgi:hypothetical protein
LKTKIYKYFTENETYRYTDVLQDFVEAYNNGIHRIIGMAPNDVTYDLEQDLWQKLYGKRLKQPYKYKVGDNVRISQAKRQFRKEYEEKYTGEIFVITSRSHNGNNPLYKLKDLADDPITGTFYEMELPPVSIDVNTSYKIEKL